MGGCEEEQLDMHANNKELFDKVHGEDQMAVDKLKEGIEGRPAYAPLLLATRLWSCCMCRRVLCSIRNTAHLIISCCDR